MPGSTALRLTVTGGEQIAAALKALGAAGDEAFGQITEGGRKTALSLKSLGEVKPDFSGLGRAAENVLQLAASADKLNAATVPQIQLLQRQVEVNDLYSRGLVDRKTVTETLIAAHDKENAALAAGLGGQRQQLDYNLQLVAAAQRYREALDPGIAASKEAARIDELRAKGLLTEVEALNAATQAERARASAAGASRPDLAGYGDVSALVGQQHASPGAQTVPAEAAAAYEISAKAAQDYEARLAALQKQTDALRASMSAEVAIEREKAQLDELVAKTDLTRAEADERLAQVTEQLTGAQAQARAATAEALADYERLVASADRYRESVNPAIALDKLRAETLEQVGVKALTAAEAYDKLKAAALAQAGLELQAGQAAPSSVERFATVGAGGGSAEGAFADAKALAAANAAATESGAKLRAEAEAESATYARLKAAVDPYIAVQRLRVEVDAAVASGALKQAEANTLVNAATTRAAAAQKALEESARGVTGATTLLHQNLLFATFDFNRLFDAINSGRQPLQAIAIELPKILDTLAFASGSALFAVVGVAVGVGAALLHLAEGHAEAKAKADEQAQATDALLQRLGVGAKTAEEFAEGVGRLTDAQRGLVAVDLAAELDKQIAALKASASEADAAAFSVKADAVTALAGPGPDVAGVGGATGDESNARLANAVDLQAKLFKDGATNALQYRDTVRDAALAQGVAADAAVALADKTVLAGLAAKGHEEAIDLVLAKETLLADPTNAAALAIVNQKSAMEAATAAAKGYEEGLGRLIEQMGAAGSKRDQFIQQQLQTYHLTDTDIGKVPADQQAGFHEKQGILAGVAGEKFDADQQREATKKLTEAEAEHAAVLREVADGTDKVALAGDKAAEAKRKALGVDEAATDEGRKAIALAKADAETRERQSESIAAAGKAKTEAARQDEFARKSAQELADSEKALADAQQGGLAQTREAVALRQAEKEVLSAGFKVDDQRYANLVREHQQTILNNQATQDAAKYEKDLQALRDKGDNAGKAVAVDAGGKSLDVGQLGGLNSVQIKEDEARAAAVKQALDRLSASEQQNQQKVAETTAVAVEAYNKELAVKQQIAAVKVDAQQALQVGQEVQLQQALEVSYKEYLDRKAVIEATNTLLAQGIDLASQDGQVRLQAEIAIKKVQQETGKEAGNLKQTNQTIADTLTKPIEDIPNVLGKSLDSAFQTLQQTGKVSGGEFAKSFAEGFQSIGANFLESAIKTPFEVVASQLKAEIANGTGFGDIFGKLDQFGSKGFLQAGVVGAAGGSVVGSIGGSIGTAITGNPNTGLGGALGGTVGGIGGGIIGSVFPVVGTVVGSLVGGAIGTALGSVFGGFFGGGNQGKNNDAQGFVYDPTTGNYTKTDKQGSPQNAQAARQLTGETASALDILRAAGLGGATDSFQFKVGNNSGIEYDGKQFASNQDAIKAAIRDLIDNTTGTITDTLKTVLANTKADSAQQLQQDVQFAATYDQLTNKTGAYGQALVDLDTQYRTAEAQAKKLGLSTDDLAGALAEAEAKLRERSLEGLRQLEGVSGPAGQALFDLGQKFDDAEKDIAALGVSEQELGDARERQTAKLREQYHFQAEALIGAFGPLGQSILQIRNNFDQARQIFLDLGESVEGLAQKQAAAEQKAYVDAEKQLQQQLSGQAQQVRGFLDGLVNPLKQALSGLGPLAGYVSPQQSLAGGLAEFRKTFASAGNDNVAAIQGLPQEAEQLLQLARSSLGSGPQFAAIFAEVQRDLRSVLTAQQGRADQTEATLPSTEQTAQQQLDALQSGFQDTVDALARLHDDWRQLGGGLAVPANVNAQLDAGSVAAAFAPQLAAQQQGNTLIAGVGDAVRLGTDRQTAAMGKMTTAIVDRLDRLERKLGQLQPGRLGNAA